MKDALIEKTVCRLFGHRPAIFEAMIDRNFPVVWQQRFCERCNRALGSRHIDKRLETDPPWQTTYDRLTKNS